ncbi:hypothetical protein ACFW9D_05150 [Streptomyces sp. NPDC059524]|uniref:hypothetical protein n=1 Tax=Streptomyces sp. NPDC059524 TaxID=3346856 RepID=UPI0036C8A9AF
MTLEQLLPAGWTLDEIREISGDRKAEPLTTDRVVTWLDRPEGNEQRLRPQIVLGFQGLCLVKPVDDEDWYMGHLEDDGSVCCWSAYSDLYEALRGL